MRRSLRYLFLKFGSTLPPAKRSEYIAWHHRRIGQSYLPESYTGDILLLYTPHRKDNSIAGWEKCTSGKIIAHCIPGKHKDLFDKPEITILAEVINRHLTK